MPANLCRYCYKEIKDRDQLVTATNFFRIKPFHYVCFNELEKEASSFWDFWKPLNGASGNIRTILLFIVAFCFFISDTLGTIGNLVAIVALYTVIMRVVSLLFIEWKIPKSKHH